MTLHRLSDIIGYLGIYLGVLGCCSMALNALHLAMPSAPAVMLRTEPVPVSALRVSIRIAGEQS